MTANKHPPPSVQILLWLRLRVLLVLAQHGERKAQEHESSHRFIIRVAGIDSIVTRQQASMAWFYCPRRRASFVFSPGVKMAI